MLSSGYSKAYGSRQKGQLTIRKALPFCFSSTQRLRHISWTHFMDFLHLHGCSHRSSGASSSPSAAKHTQHLRLASVDEILFMTTLALEWSLATLALEWSLATLALALDLSLTILALALALEWS